MLESPSELKVQNVEEKAIQYAFDNPVHLLCTKHLRNTRQYRTYLNDKERCSTNGKELVASSTF